MNHTISPACELVTRWDDQGHIAAQCGKPTSWWYPAAGGPYATMALCEEHAQRYQPRRPGGFTILQPYSAAATPEEK